MDAVRVKAAKRANDMRNLQRVGGDEEDVAVKTVYVS
jgi:hypothetical protein